MMKITQILFEEHKNILKAIEIISIEAENTKQSNKIDKEFYYKAIDFIRNYADKFHHAKEENILFVELSKNTSQMPCGPIKQMLHEHDLGREYIRAVELGVGQNDVTKVAENVVNYASLLAEHIYKEDNILYPMADEVLSQEIQENMLVQFQGINESFKDLMGRELLFLE